MTSELKQALEHAVVYPHSIEVGHRDDPQPILEAAGLVVLWKEDCQTCGGTGWTEEPSATGTGSFQQPCDDCGGRGWNPTAQAIELLARSSYEWHRAQGMMAPHNVKVGEWPEWDDLPDVAHSAWRAMAQVSLSAVLSMGETK